MKVEDLRIGNLVSIKYTDSNLVEKQGETRIIGLSEEGNLGDGWKIEVEALEEIFENVECYPIELTEEILLKCGFVRLKENHNFLIHNHEVNLKIEIRNKWIAWCNSVLTNVQVKHLHQLQNLYYSLTKQELEINL